MRLLPISAIVLAFAGQASAGPIVLESYGGQRPEGADRLLAPVMAELSRSGFPTLDQVAGQISERVSRPAGRLDDAGAEEATRAIQTGYKQFTSGDFDGAIATIERGLSRLLAAPGSLAGNTGRRDAVMRGLLGAALAHRRRGRQTEATAAMAELVRSFPDREISYKEYGPEPRDFYQKVQADLARDGRGTLKVDVDDDKAVVFVNERYAGVGDVTLPDLYPGRYRVFVQQGDELGRVHEVEIEPGQTASVGVAWQFDAALRDGARLEFPDESARRDREPRHVVRIARALGAPSVVVLGIRDNRGRQSVVGAVYSADSTRPLRSGAVAVEPVMPALDRLEALARLLAGDEAARRWVAPLGEAGGADATDGDGDRPARVWKWVALGAGVAAVGTGVALIALHRTAEDGTRDPSERNTRTAGIITASAGAALTGLGVTLFFKDARDRRSGHTAALVPTAGGATLVLSGSF